MSEYVGYKGTLKLMQKLNDETLEEQCKKLVNDLTDGEIDMSYYDTFEDALLDEFYNEYYVHDNNLYGVERDEYCEQDIFKGERENKNIKFQVQYYNGGCSFDEALDKVMKNITK